jgi:NADH-ubiquinone oxidoreductase chain 5
MILACGFSLYSTSLFHFFNHAFFKALLFLSAGSVIHALAGEQDLYNMGGLDVYLPFTAQMFLIGSTALASFPFLSGFYSKDWILEVSSMLYFFDGLLMFTLVTQAAIFTMLYSDSLARFAFDGDENFSSAKIMGAGESGWKMVTSLAILAVPSMFSGFIFKELFIGFGVFTFSDSIFLLPVNAHFFESDFLPAYYRILPVITSFFLIFLVIFGFDFLGKFFTKLINRFGAFFSGVITLFVDFFSLNWFYDTLLNYVILRILLPFSREVTFKLLDKGVLELFGPYSIANSFVKYSTKTASITTGYIFHYAFIMIIGLSSLLFLNLLDVLLMDMGLIWFQFILFFIFFLNFEDFLKIK